MGRQGGNDILIPVPVVSALSSVLSITIKTGESKPQGSCSAISSSVAEFSFR